MNRRDEMTRRNFLTTGTAAGAAALTLGCAAAPWPGIRWGMGTYGFRYFTDVEMVALTKQLGIDIIELWPGHANILGGGERDRSIKPYHVNPSAWSRIQTVCEMNTAQVLTYGVTRFSDDAAENRAILQWAQDNGIEAVSCNPSDSQLDSLDTILEDIPIRLGIHNHGPNDTLYGKISQVEKALANHHELLGACVDVGHFWRSKEDPVEAIETFGSRVHGVHVKDQNNDEEMSQAVIGEGQLDLPGIMAALKRVNYTGVTAMEYEDNEEDPMPNMHKSMDYLRQVVADLG